MTVQQRFNMLRGMVSPWLKGVGRLKIRKWELGFWELSYQNRVIPKIPNRLAAQPLLSVVGLARLLSLLGCFVGSFFGNIELVEILTP